MDRQEHLDWCKRRALEYVDQGDIPGAIASISSDLGKHAETEKHAGIMLGMMMLMGGQLRDEKSARDFINGFN